MFEQITILGPGLLGASLAMAVKDRRIVRHLTVWDHRPEIRQKSSQEPWCDAVAETPEEAVTGSELVVVCTPVKTIVPLLERIRKNLIPAALVTDVGSTKGRICQKADGLFETADFIGSHPMAGSERTGMEHARGNLFEGAACIVTPLDGKPSIASHRIRTFWEALGMNVSIMSPGQHDAIVADISHLPHLLAAALCTHLSEPYADQGDATYPPSLSGSGLRDVTRIASSDPDLWWQILEQNREAILQALSGFEEKLKVFKTTLENKDFDEMKRLLERGKNYRDRLNR